MNIIGKTFRHIKNFDSYTVDDLTGLNQYYKGFISIYIYNNKIVSSSIKDEITVKKMGDFGEIDLKLRNLQIKNLDRQIKKSNDPVSIGNYSVLDNNKIEMMWNYYHGESIELIFKGELLLNGDAIKGTFYKNGEVNVSERVYYNIDKPLPESLIEEK